jgi:hypothetical protein
MIDIQIGQVIRFHREIYVLLLHIAYAMLKF